MFTIGVMACVGSHHSFLPGCENRVDVCPPISSYDFVTDDEIGVEILHSHADYLVIYCEEADPTLNLA
jgi:hypothetical protein